MKGDDRADTLLPLLVWLSPAFPVGAFAYSHGLETAVDLSLVHDSVSLEAWLTDVLGQGSMRQDAVLAAVAFRAAHRADELAEINDLALALAPGRERRLEAAQMGRAFADAMRTAWPQAAAVGLPATGELAYPVAFGAACGVLALRLEDCLAAYALAFVSNLVSAAVRLGPIGQTDGQRIISRLAEPARALGRWAATAGTDDLGAAAFRSDVAALQHETLYSRLFRS